MNNTRTKPNFFQKSESYQPNREAGRMYSLLAFVLAIIVVAIVVS